MSHYNLREYPLQQGALEIAYIEEFFNEFPKRKTANEIMSRLQDRECQILMAEAPLEEVLAELQRHFGDPAETLRKARALSGNQTRPT